MTTPATTASTSAPDLPPSAQQLLFARALILTFRLWPSMRLAITEEWGGPDSQDKSDFLVSHLCDLYGGVPGATSLGVHEPNSSVADVAAADGAASPPAAPPAPEQDDIAELLEGYLADEFDARIEDGSCDFIAARITDLHKVIFARPSDAAAAAATSAQEVLARAQATVAQLQDAADQSKGTVPQAQRAVGNGDDDGESGSQDDDGSDGDGDDGGGDDDAMDVDDAAPPRQPRQKQEPIVDKDGFTTVVPKGKRK